MKIQNVLIMALVMAVLFMSSASAATVYCVNCSDCNEKIANASIGDVVILTADITDCSVTCIDFDGKDGIVFDGGGHMIDGTDTSGTYGIYMYSHVDNNIVRNCTVTDFDKGIYMFTSNYNTIENVTSSSNRGTGLTNLYGQENVIRDCVFQENRADDFYFKPDNGLDCSNLLVNVTGSGGRPIGFYNTTVDINDTDFSSLYLCYGSMSTFDNVTVAGSDVYDNNGVRMYYSYGVELTNFTVTDNYNGFHMTDCYNCVIRDSFVDGNSYYGMYVYRGGDNVVENTIVNDSDQVGIYLSGSDNNVINNVSITDNYGSGMNIFSSDLNTINNSRIEGNDIIGVRIIDALDNSFYNNVFNNSDNVGAGGVVYPNSWNVSIRTGPNIIGGPSIGGNYWSDYDYGDMDGDGFGMSPYVVEWFMNNTDFLPLVEVSGGEEMYIRNWNVTLYRGDVWEYIVTCRNESGFDVECGEMSWNSSNTTVGTMDGANMTCHSAGYTNVTATGFNGTDTITAEVQYLECGDVDCNGYISANDVIETYLRAINPTYEIGSEWAANVDGNTYISANDVINVYLRAINPSHSLNCV